ncbi:helix-turn-helix domain-containing protein [Adlercreutzia sp. ZJ138]|uniref:helix-turn-helix domain-containing protein n=1 Tax=Adlercreutzia sp. ZJ138 TaxID=2709405 RepID=UPI0013ED9807|nr:helix-turn-helix transcriptional regulator [Adlercreutzia sp. ZJ138]
MASDTRMDSVPARVRTNSPLAELRRAAGYRSSRDFAAVLGIPATTYSRYERNLSDPESGIPLRAAWAIADKLHCSIDAVVGRDAAAGEDGRDLAAAYRTLSAGGKERFDEYLQFLAFRDQLIALQRSR